MRIPFLAATVATLSLISAVQAQKVYGGADPDRKGSNVFVFTDSFEALAGVAINYSQPEWKEIYNEHLKAMEGNYLRLGKNWWTTFDTVGKLEIGGTVIEAGSYFLGLSVGKDNAFSLVLFNSHKAMKSGLLPFSTSLYTGEAKGDATAPLTLAIDSLKETVVKMEIEITADEKDPTSGKFSVRWGKHELSAPVKFHLAGAKDEAAPKK